MSDEDREIEELLLRYRPVSPPPELRGRTLACVSAARSRSGWLLAAGFAIAALLHWAAARSEARTAWALGHDTEAELEAAVDAVLETQSLPRAYVKACLRPPRRVLPVLGGQGQNL